MINGKFNPFGNADEKYPDNYHTDKPEWVRTLYWWARNPLHNFMFHWIGVSGRVLQFRGEFLADGWRIAWTITKNLSLPVVSFRGEHVEFYIGWRKNGGFGIALRKANSKQAGDPSR